MHLNFNAETSSDSVVDYSYAGAVRRNMGNGE